MPLNKSIPPEFLFLFVVDVCYNCFIIQLNYDMINKKSCLNIIWNSNQCKSYEEQKEKLNEISKKVFLFQSLDNIRFNMLKKTNFKSEIFYEKQEIYIIISFLKSDILLIFKIKFKSLQENVNFSKNNIYIIFFKAKFTHRNLSIPMSCDVSI